MLKEINYKSILFRGILFVFLVNVCFAETSAKLIYNSNQSDTLDLDEISLDSARFYITEDLSNAENTIRDTIYMEIDGKMYKLPYRITATTKVVFNNRGQYFRLTGLPLGRDAALDNYITELFKNPREKLKDPIPAKQWKNSSIYLRYFEPYDRNSNNRINSKDETTKEESNELKEFLSDEGDIYVEQNYQNFPLPETIDIEVDLKKSPGTVTILDLEFDFDKLDKGFQRLLLEYEKANKNQIKKSNSQKKN